VAGRLQDKVAIATGATGGVGRAIVEKSVREGATVAVVARSRAGLDEQVREIGALGGAGMAVPTDVGDETDVIDMVVATVAKAYGKIDILVNRATVPDPTASLVDLKLEDWSKAFAVDLVGTVL
jgi:NAD(P)-dependent dehydrogenase (short-subunit alcohol dehydrogenase family)